ncbi:MAG: hypothetical protein ACREQV_07180 [Candidatus Binatia bacterium]
MIRDRGSAARAQAGLEPAPAWLTIEPTLCWFGPDQARAEQAWRHFVETRRWGQMIAVSLLQDEVGRI